MSRLAGITPASGKRLLFLLPILIKVTAETNYVNFCAGNITFMALESVFSNLRSAISACGGLPLSAACMPRPSDVSKILCSEKASTYVPTTPFVPSYYPSDEARRTTLAISTSDSSNHTLLECVKEKLPCPSTDLLGLFIALGVMGLLCTAVIVYVTYGSCTTRSACSFGRREPADRREPTGREPPPTTEIELRTPGSRPEV